MKNNDAALLCVTSAICLLPLVLSAILYGDLPDRVAVHWNIAGVADNYLPKWAAAFGLPLFLAAINVFLQLFINNDPKKENVSAAMRLIIRWLICALSVTVMPVTLFIALGRDIPIVTVVTAFVGVLTVIFGNYLPKSRQNYTVGIRLPWTLHDADNWNRTHLMAGRLWVLCGVAMILETFLLGRYPFVHLPLILAVIGIMILAPIAYSYRLFKRAGKTRED